MSSELYIGLMSGTSMDAVDCALVDLSDPSSYELIDFINIDIPAELKNQLISLCQESSGDQIQTLGEADVTLGKLFASTALSILEKNHLDKQSIRAIGSHGQTIRHQPPGQSEQSFSIQIGDPNTITALTGITTVADFRRKDIALGGQGAPLLPAFHQQILSSATSDRIILNIGGMANITLLKKDNPTIIGFDTGPGNILLDGWIQLNKNQSYDANGDWAASGNYNQELLDLMLEDHYFLTPPPKSTGREQFNTTWLNSKMIDFGKQLNPEDVQATLVQLSVVSIAEAVDSLLSTGEVIVCGGGARNLQLMLALTKQLPNFNVTTSDTYGVNSDAMEAIAFAWFAKQALDKNLIDLSQITGSSSPQILGAVYANS